MAVVGASRDPRKYSSLLLREVLKHGYKGIPVNPMAEEVDGRKCYKSIKEIKPPPKRAVIVLARDKTEQAVLDCAAAGVKDVWLHRHVAGGVSDMKAVLGAQEEEIRLITCFCLFMFLPRSPFIHKVHGGVLKLIGVYPK